MANLFHSNNAQLHNYMAAVLFVFVFGLFSFIAYVIWAKFVTGFELSGLYNGTIKETGDKFTQMFLFHDWAILLVVIAMCIGLIVTSYKIKTSAIGYIITLAFGLFFLVVSYFMNYLFAEIIGNVAFTEYLFYFPRTSILLTNLHWLGLVFIIIGSIALYAKRGDNDTEAYLR